MAKNPTPWTQEWIAKHFSRDSFIPPKFVYSRIPSPKVRFRSKLYERYKHKCPRCCRTKWWADFYEDQTRASGHTKYCKLCSDAVSTRRHRTSAGWLISKTGRQCSRCHRFKRWESYSIHKGDATGHQSRCKVCRNKVKAAKRALRRKLLNSPRTTAEQNFFENMALAGAVSAVAKQSKEPV